MELSTVIPVLNEADNVGPLLDEILGALRPLGIAFEVIFVDDGSDDDTVACLRAREAEASELRIVRHAHRYGQSMGVRSGVLAAQGTWVATLDGDRQNDPADLPKLWALTCGAHPPSLIAGERTVRRDSLKKKLTSKIGNGIRRRVLGDSVRDTGCGLKMFRRDLFLALPHFDHMHRFLPALAKRQGAGLVTVPVNHRHRLAGRSKYGTLDRALVAIADLFGVWWLMRRGHFPVETVKE